MGNITNPYNGKKTFFKGRGRKGNTKLDNYQKMLLESENKNFDNEPKQKPLSKAQLKRGGYTKPKSLNQLARWK
jgi:hypothetical protein